MAKKSRDLQPSGVSPADPNNKLRAIMNDDELDHLIRRTSSPPEFSPSFQREVWARVSVTQEGSWAARGRRWREAFFPVLGRPATALATVLVMLLPDRTDLARLHRPARSGLRGARAQR